MTPFQLSSLVTSRVWNVNEFGLVDATRWPPSVLMSVTMTWAPSRAKAMAIPSP